MSNIARADIAQLPTSRSYGTDLAWIWVSWIIVLFILSLSGSIFPDAIWRGDLAVVFHSVGAVAFLGLRRQRVIAALLVTSLLLRIVLIYWDLHMSHIFSLPNSGSDSEMFFYWAVEVARDPSLVFVDIQGGGIFEGLWLIILAHRTPSCSGAIY